MRDAIEYSDRIIMLDKRQIVFDKPSPAVTEEELIEIYRKNLS